MIHPEVWKAVVKEMRRVDDLLKDEEEGAIELVQGKKLVTCSLGGDSWWVGIHTFDVKGIVPFRCMNLDVEEWEQLKKNVEAVNTLLVQGAKIGKRRREQKLDKVEETVLMYRWVYKAGDGPLQQGIEWYFTERDALADGQKIFGKNDKALTVIWEWRQLVNAHDLMEFIFHYYIFKGIERRLQAEGSADKLSVLDVLAEYGPPVINDLKAHDLSRFFDTCRTIMGATSVWSYSLASSILRYACVEHTIAGLLTGLYTLPIPLQALFACAIKQIPDRSMQDF